MSSATLRQSTALLVAVLAIGLLPSCAARYSIHEVRASGFEVQRDAYVSEDSTLVVSYDFWGVDGVPYISFYNASRDTLELDLRTSTVDGGWSRQSLGRVLGGGTSGYSDLVYNYPGMRFSPGGNSLYLLPGQWHSFYGMAQHPGAPYGGRRRTGRSVYDYEVYSGSERLTYTHVFTDRLQERMSRRVFKRYGDATAAGNVYYCDRGPQRGLLAMEILTAVLNVAIFL